MFKCINGQRVELTKEEEEEFLKRQEVTEERNLKEEKEKKIKVVKGLCQDLIYQKYSLTTQLNIQNKILGYTQEDYNSMKVFIEKQVNKCRDKIKEIEKCKTLKSLDKINIG